MDPSTTQMFLIRSVLFLLICTTNVVNGLPTSTTKTTTSASNRSYNPSDHGEIYRSVCKDTPYPDACFQSLINLPSISITISPNIITYLLQSLHTAISEASKLSDLLYANNGIVEKQKGALQDCRELHQITVSSLKRSLSRISASSSSSSSSKLVDAMAFLSAALTNKDTCLGGLDSASGPLKPILVDSLTNTYKHVSNSLYLLSRNRPLLSHQQQQKMKKNKIEEDEDIVHHSSSSGRHIPSWLSRKDMKILEDDEYGDDTAPTPSYVLTVAADGSGNFTTITDAINFAPNNSVDNRIFIYVRQGLYQENVDIPIYKPNIILLGDGSDVTVITGSRSVGDNWTTFRSATVAVSGEGFLARDIRFENTAGPGKHQAVALRVSADLTAVYRCVINGYQDTLYVHSFRQFYRECDIYGTIDYIFGNAAVVFQGCNIVSRMPMPGQFTVITAQARESPDETTGISIQNCSILATDELYSKSSSAQIKSYLGRPWRNYSRTVFLESYIDDFIHPSGWIPWPGNQGLDTLYYGEYQNIGPGSAIDNRITWPGYHIMDYYDASNFTLSEFISGQEWLESTSFPYDDGV